MKNRVPITRENAGIAVEMRTYHHTRGVFPALVVGAFTILAFAVVIVAVLAVNMPGVPARNMGPATTLIACRAQPVQFACRVSGGQK
jgi:hypothetical protein